MEGVGRYDRDFLALLDSKKLPLFQRWNFQKKVELPKVHIFVEVFWKFSGRFLEAARSPVTAGIAPFRMA
jgi:hypothetical protein